jgi:hypothetical protein
MEENENLTLRDGGRIKGIEKVQVLVVGLFFEMNTANSFLETCGI